MILNNNPSNQPNHLGQIINLINQKSNPLLDNILQNSLSQNQSTNINQSDFLKNIFNIIKNGDLGQNAIFEMLKNHPTLKSGGTFGENLTQLLNLLNKSTIENSENLNKILTNIKNIQPQILQNSLLNSGIFLESNLLKKAMGNLDIQDLTKDIKSILLQLKLEVESKILNQNNPNNQNILNQTEKLISQIEYFQLLSIYGNGNYFYLPFYWEDLLNGTIYTKKDDEKTYCEIELELQNYGNIKIMVFLFDKDTLDISFSFQNSHFKEVLQNNMQLLRIALNKANFNILGIKIIDKQNNKNPYMSLEQNQTHSLDIKI